MASQGAAARNNGPMYGPKKPRKTFVLLFDGTGNKFSGTDGDSNILKILRMLDRSDSSQLHYYQPGIGTYVHSNTYSHTSVFTRVNSWLQKTRDSAVGTSFDVHVMGGYKFLMKYYASGDDIYFFGFSRGAYIARFLAEMLDYVGLLEPGNEEMARFAWKAFAQWQMRLDGTEEEKENKKKMFHYLSAFRDTFSRPVRRIRFLGLFDTVNSVPRFENAWMQRSKFPYTAKSSALVIRHAVGIDERRAKFRQDLISERRQADGVHRGRPVKQNLEETLHVPQKSVTPHKEMSKPNERYRRKSHVQHHHDIAAARERSMSPTANSLQPVSEKEWDGHSLKTSDSMLSLPPTRKDTNSGEDEDEDEIDEGLPQDIQEIWFPGGHADIGGGWPLGKGEDLPLSHGPLVWMVREARKAGLRFDEEKMIEMRCLDPEAPEDEVFGTYKGLGQDSNRPQVPEFKVTGPESPGQEGQNGQRSLSAPREKTKFHGHLHSAAQQGILHDCLEYGQGLTRMSVASWNFMEYLPFKRMDLMPDSSWRSIRWPLPKGEVRDMPDGALIHTSALRRMEANPNYRPGNLIVGGGGRGVKKAPPEYGMGEWEFAEEEGDPVGECVQRQKKNKGANGEENRKEKNNGKQNGH